MLWLAPPILLLALLLALSATVVVRAVTVRPVAGTRLLSFDGFHVSGTCTDSPSSLGGHVLVCDGTIRALSNFVVVDHNAGAVAWCMEHVDQGHFNTQAPAQFGPLLISAYHSIPTDWSGCTEMLPIQTGFYAHLILKH